MNSWMTTLVKTYPAATLRDVILTGTHDSYSYTADPHKISSDDSNFKACAPLIGCPGVSCVATSWTTCTDKTVYDQLCLGVRLISVDVSKYLPEGAYYATHTMCCVPLQHILDQIARFLTETTEVVLLKVTLRANAVASEVNDLLNALKCLVPPTLDPFTTPLKALTESNARLFACGDGLPYAAAYIQSNWMNTADPTVAVQRAEARLGELASFKRSAQGLLGFSWVLTPQTQTVLNGLLCGLYGPVNLEAMARGFNRRFLSFVSSHQTEVLQNAHFVVFDYVTEELVNALHAMTLRKLSQWFTLKIAMH